MSNATVRIVNDLIVSGESTCSEQLNVNKNIIVTRQISDTTNLPIFEAKNSPNQYCEYNYLGNFEVNNPENTTSRIRLGSFQNKTGIYSNDSLLLMCENTGTINWAMYNRQTNTIIDKMRLVIGKTDGPGTLEISGINSLPSSFDDDGNAIYDDKIRLYKSFNPQNAIPLDTRTYGTSSDRPDNSDVHEGLIRFETDNSDFVYWDGTDWINLLSTASSGGDIIGDNLFLGGNNESPKIELKFKDVTPDTQDTNIIIGQTTDDITSEDSTVNPNTPGYGINIQAMGFGNNIDSSGVFFGLKQKLFNSNTKQNWEPYIKWVHGGSSSTSFSIISTRIGNKEDDKVYNFNYSGTLTIPQAIICKNGSQGEDTVYLYGDNNDAVFSSYLYRGNNPALKQSNLDGTTTISAPAGMSINFNIDSQNKMKINETITEIYTPLNVGNATIGNLENAAGFAHPSYFNLNSYALRQIDTGETILNARANTFVSLRINADEKMKIDNSEVNIFNQLRVSGWITSTFGALQSTNYNAINLRMFNSNAGGKYWRVGPENNNTCVFYSSNGTGVFIGHRSTSWSANSDERIKKNITELTDCLTTVNQVRAVKYNFISENDTDEKHIGFIAQDFQNILPEVISNAPQDTNIDFTVLGIAYTETIPLLLGAIKELDAKVQNQQIEINYLKAENSLLKSKLNELLSEAGKETI